MANKYTKEELILLHDTAPKSLHFNSIKMHFIGSSSFDSEVISEKIYNHIRAYNGCGPEYRNFLDTAYSFLFVFSYEDLPLYINVQSEDIIHIVKWRLQIGK